MVQKRGPNRPCLAPGHNVEVIRRSEPEQLPDPGGLVALPRYRAPRLVVHLRRAGSGDRDLPTHGRNARLAVGAVVCEGARATNRRGAPQSVPNTAL